MSPPPQSTSPGKGLLAAQPAVGPGGHLLKLGHHARKLARSVYSGSVTSALREAIIGGEIAQGTALVERTLAEQLNMSRGPIRNALSILEGEGLVTTLPNGRMVVAGFGLDDLSDLLAVRYELESTAIRWACDSKREVQPVLDMLAEMEGEGTSTALLVDLDMNFHRAMVELSGSRFLLQAWLAIAPVVHTVITLGNRTLERDDPVSNFHRIIDSHQEIVDPLRAHQPDRALERLADQFQFTRSMFVPREQPHSSRKGS